jgi:hypothetical protein
VNAGDEADFPTAIERSTFSRLAVAGLMVKGMKIRCPAATLESPVPQTGVFASSVAGEVNWA